MLRAHTAGHRPYVGNWDLMWKTLRQAYEHPDTYDQSWWWHTKEASSCGTTRCIAGWAAYFGGYHEPNMANATDAGLLTEYFGFQPESTHQYDHVMISPTGAVVNADVAALWALDAVNCDDVVEMFASYMSFGSILRRAEELAEADGVETPDWLEDALDAHPTQSGSPDYYDDDDDSDELDPSVIPYETLEG